VVTPRAPAFGGTAVRRDHPRHRWASNRCSASSSGSGPSWPSIALDLDLHCLPISRRPTPPQRQPAARAGWPRRLESMNRGPQLTKNVGLESVHWQLRRLIKSLPSHALSSLALIQVETVEAGCCDAWRQRDGLQRPLRSGARFAGPLAGQSQSRPLAILPLSAARSRSTTLQLRCSQPIRVTWQPCGSGSSGRRARKPRTTVSDKLSIFAMTRGIVEMSRAGLVRGASHQPSEPAEHASAGTDFVPWVSFPLDERQTNLSCS